MSSAIRKSLMIFRQHSIRTLFTRIVSRLLLWKQYIASPPASKSVKHGRFFPESSLAHKYCLGKGLEIGGSAHNPFGLHTMNVDFTDSLETEFKKEEIRQCGREYK